MTEAIDQPATFADAVDAVDAAHAAMPLRAVDFDRPVLSILGLPFDAIGLEEAVQRIRGAAFANRRCFVSTPNLNFAIAARHDTGFRGSLLRSDLCLADGMPLVWIARLLRLPVRERVSGADVFAALQAHAGPALRIFLFGGPPGAAAAASERINRTGAGLRCVGFDGAGFGSIEAMSDEARIAAINASGAHFVVVSLGAKKGQAWIEHNASRLTAPVLSHLGAVMNFAAGTVSRASLWMQRAGLEWLWRIKEEPLLWQRYARDGWAAAWLVASRVLPDRMQSRSRTAAVPPARIEIADESGRSVLRLQGIWRDDDVAPLRTALTRCAQRAAPVTIDLSGVTAMGAVASALLLLAKGWFGGQGGVEIVGASPALARSMRRRMVSITLLGID